MNDAFANSTEQDGQGDPPSDGIGALARQNDDHYRALGFVIRILQREESLVLQRRIAHENVSVAMSIFIRCLWEQEGLTQRELAEAANLVEGTTADILQQMEMKGLIVRVRNAADRRKMNIYLTQPAKELYLRLKVLHKELDSAVSAGISNEELAVFRSVAERMTANLARERRGAEKQSRSARKEKWEEL